MTEGACALYARVSSESQARDNTIASQVTALRECIAADGFQLEPDHNYVDEGYSGAILFRPALERLRDAVAGGHVERIYVHAPDRLARRYAHQVLLIDEFHRAGAEVVFLNRPIGGTAEDDLLLQVQGVIAEYERAKILERGRRGRRHAAQSGSVSALTGSPFGYRYVSRTQGGGVARFEVVEEEAHIVQLIFAWVGLDRISLREVCRRLRQMECQTRGGTTNWYASTIRGMLDNPAYIGRAAFGSRKYDPMNSLRYYRCTGADGYRFSGKAVCNNGPVRSDQLEQVVWNQVRALLQEPRRVADEFRRRIAQARHGAAMPDEIVRLDRQMTSLRRGIGRLIDSYAEGVIEKTEFEPRIAGLKQRMSQLQERHQAARDAAETEHDLALVISRLEDFSAKVNTSLNNLDRVGMQDIIRIVVRRIEIDESRIEVIFRVPSADGPAGPRTPIKSTGSWQHCTGVGRTHHCLAQPLPPPRQGLGKSQPKRPRILETRVHSSHVAKAL